MKILLALILLFAISCTNETGGRYRGRIVEMTYNPLNRQNNSITVLTGTDSKRIFDSPNFEQLNPGDDVIVECTSGFSSRCYITSKVAKE